MSQRNSARILSLVNIIKKGSIINSCSYLNGNLVVLYESGKKIIYEGIDKEHYDELNNSEDKQKHILSKISNKFRSKKVEIGEDEDCFSQLMSHLDPYVKAVCRKYYLSGKDYDDILQDARISIYKAVHDFRENENTSFENFAVRTCVQRRIYTEIDKSLKRQKSIPLNTATSLDIPIVSNCDDSSSQIMSDLIEDTNADPLKILIDCEDKYHIRNFLDSELTELEAAVLESYENGDPYKEIANKLGLTIKCVDNSLGRIRKKASKMFEINEKSISTVIYRSRKRK
jgi:RNA polymerase sporulation-specific sigma factor